MIDICKKGRLDGCFFIVALEESCVMGVYFNVRDVLFDICHGRLGVCFFIVALEEQCVMGFSVRDVKCSIFARIDS